MKTKNTKRNIYKNRKHAPDETRAGLSLCKQGGCGSVVVKVRLHLVNVEGLGDDEVKSV